jgi:hypothetical protein
MAPRHWENNMAAQSHGGKRLGAGRPKVADVQFTARVSGAASKTIKAHGLDCGIAAGVRNLADFSAAVTAQLPPGSAVWVSFQRLSGSRAKAVDEAYREIVSRLLADGGRPVVYRCGRDLLTVKARIPLGNDTSLWLSVPAMRVQPPSKQEYEADIRKIELFLVDAGLDAVWA